MAAAAAADGTAAAVEVAGGRDSVRIRMPESTASRTPDSTAIRTPEWRMECRKKAKSRTPV